MNTAPSKLSIQVKLQPDCQPPYTRGIHKYRWDRILGALLGVVLIVGGGATGWHWVIGGPVEEGEPTSSLAVEETAEEQRLESAALVTTDIPRDIWMLSTTEYNPSASSAPAELPEKADTDVAEQLKQADIKIEQALLGSKRPPPTEDEHQASELLAQTQSDIEILSSHILRAQLSNEIQDREPVDVASAVIPMNDEGLVTVYLFTELEGLQGQTVYYDWYRGEKREARVALRPHLSSMRAYASKFIDRHMLGEWRVEVQTAAGEPLAQGDFEVR